MRRIAIIFLICSVLAFLAGYFIASENTDELASADTLLQTANKYVVAILVLVDVFIVYAWIREWILDRRRPFDPQWLIELAKDQCPEEPWLPEALTRCTSASYRGSEIYFVSSRNANKPGAGWQYDYSIELDHPEYALILLDVLKGRRIGAVEFVFPLPGAKIHEAGRKRA